MQTYKELIEVIITIMIREKIKSLFQTTFVLEKWHYVFLNDGNKKGTRSELHYTCLAQYEKRAGFGESAPSG